MNILVLAAGEGSRWGCHLGVPKHLIPLPEGRTLLQRTVALFSPHGHITVVAPDRRYIVPGAALFIPPAKPEDYEAARFTSSRCLWHPGRRNLLLWGDVWFSREAAEIIAAPVDGWRWYARLNGSDLTGCPYGEGFALTFLPADIPQIDAALAELIRFRQAGELEQCRGWELYDLLAHRTPTSRAGSEHLVEIDDWTDDFDSPQDWHRWLERYAARVSLPTAYPV